ncbi:S8 family serine peptidase [Polaribacter sp.]|nr:S8 family serine peptidase [Polaribacter sp.]
MKKLLLLLVFITSILSAQVSQKQNSFADFVPGEIIVKLNDDFDASVSYARDGSAVSSMNIGEFLGISDKVKSSSMLFHQKSIESSVLNKQKMLTVYASKAAANANNGFRPQEPVTMKNVFVLKTENTNENILSLIDQIKENPNVEYAEPNYLFGLDNFEVGEMISAEEASKLPASTVIDVDDPLYSVQSNITSTNLDDVWDTYSTGDGTQVVAILDTGVDYNHPDLAANTWINLAEQNGVAGFDDDGNGYIDDIQGWDFINADNAPLDDNIHGTHVAGIVGAVGNNGIGIAGAAWNVKLMPIKVLQSTGSGNAATVAAGIEYAANNGATIINMSLGSGADSSVMRAALENAYATAVLVGSAGNSQKCIGPGLCPDQTLSSPSYPGAYSFVLGVQDAASYSNYDQDGPIATGYINLLNYETYAPGSGIMSTAPNGGYVPLTGTSMAGPLVAGGLALYLKEKPDVSTEILFGDLINTSATYVDFLAAIEVVATPELAVLSVIERDTINGQNGNGIIQAGETVELLPLIRNYWGPTDDVRVGIAFAEFEDQTKATIIEDEIEIGSISAYATLQDLNESLKITIGDNVANNVQIKFVVTTWSGPNKDYLSDELEVVINIKNSILLSGLITSDMTLSPDKEYLVASNVVVTGDAVITIMPGTTLKFSDDKQMSFIDTSRLICEGTKEDPINIIAENIYYIGFIFNSVSNNPAWHSLKFTNFSGVKTTIFPDSKSYVYEDGIVSNSYGAFYEFFENRSDYIIIRRVNFVNNTINPFTRYTYRSINQYYLDGYITSMGDYYSELPKVIRGDYTVVYNVYDINFIDNVHSHNNTNYASLIVQNLNEPKPYPRFNAFGNQSSYQPDLTLISSNSSDIGVVKPQLYLGSSSEEISETRTWHFLNDGGVEHGANPTAIFDMTEISTTPYETTHGIVWKVLVNDKDAQDEYALMDPVGVGNHVFKVYFNRAMDTTVDPQISYGVIQPYNQKIITESGTWSADGKIYTVTHAVAVGAADGINRIRVQDARDLDFFEIPVEKSRFNMLLQSAGSLSTGFMATPGLGNIALEWDAPDASNLNDVLGYNMYRYITNADGTFSDPVKLNQTVIIEDSDAATTGVYFTDYEVVEEQSYFYKYKVVRTNFDETDYSTSVSATPLTSILGDGNGDFTVNVLDLVQDVDYILNNNPSPFIFAAADVNNDEAINVLDIVGTVDIILNAGGRNGGTTSGTINYYSNIPVGDAVFSWEGNDLYVTSNDDIGGIQLAFNEGFEYVLSSELPRIEHLNYAQDASEIVMLYSFNNTTIANTKTKILTRLDATQDFNIEQAVVGTTFGAKLNATLDRGALDAIDAPFQSNQLEILNLYPNPSKGLVNVQYYLPEQMDQVIATVYDLQGRKVFMQRLTATVGNIESTLQLNKLSEGSYIVLMSAHKDGGVKYLSHKTLILE